MCSAWAGQELVSGYSLQLPESTAECMPFVSDKREIYLEVEQYLIIFNTSTAVTVYS